MWHVVLFQLVLLGSCTYALWRGGGPERWGAGLELVACLATGLIQLQVSADHRFSTLLGGIFLVDGLFLASLCVLALTADRFWPIAAAGFGVADIIVHLSKVAAPEMLPYGYAWGIQIWGWPKLFLFAIGTRRHQQRLALYGKDPSWSRPRATARAPRNA